ncbi:MAG: type I DNA topoisomerase [Rhodospirillaceae bacterium]|nr:type I DNA topoisomerase [Rhodospirillaceae bacterium]
MDVVVVESPAKAQTINKYLGSGYKVLASYGHVRDLVEKDGSVDPAQDFEMKWELRDKRNSIGEIAKSLKSAKRLILATDPDREGEAISWHLEEVLRQKGALKGIDVQRVTFNQITRDAVRQAMQQPRNIDHHLVDAYRARRALDYLVGFTLSPVLWRKLPGSRSAGRVQSVALRLVCERESEIELFRAQEYWTVEVDFLTLRNEPFTARLTHLDGKRLDKLGLGSRADAEAAVQAILASAFAVDEIERRELRRNPPPPFNTSSLQQEASRKLGFGANRTMRTAQRLYEGVDIEGDSVGLITYMRTDSVTLSAEAVAATRKLIGEQYGADYVPPEPRVYKTKAKNAQEAHEAIRPSELFRTPEQVARFLDDDQRKLYELIWKRTVACEMASAVLDQVAVDIASQNRLTKLRATGSVIKFDGFLKLYREDRDDQSEDEDEENRLLPSMSKGETLKRGSRAAAGATDDKARIEHDGIAALQHFTQPPPRYTEASLVKKLEELGIGRPSTYAQILTVLQDRGYVKMDKRRFVPEDRGRVLVSFLTEFFGRYVEYDFTADLENQLDEISGGSIDWKKVLRDFWVAFDDSVAHAKTLRISDVIDALDAALGPHFFPPRDDGADPRKCPACGTGRLGLKVGKFGGFIGCSNYPDCSYTRQLAIADPSGAAAPVVAEARLLGVDPATNLSVYLKDGPYGPYVQLGDQAPKGEKPKRASVPKGFDLNAVDLELALKLLALPREVGKHPESGQPILANIGRYGPYIQHGKDYRNLPTPGDVLTIGLNHAVSLLAEPRQRRGASRPPEREVGVHPTLGETITAAVGRYGPYVRLGKTYANLPQGTTPETVTLDEAVPLIDARIEKSGNKPAKAKKPAKAAKGKAGKEKENGATAEAPKAKPRSKGGAKTKAAPAEKAPPAKKSAKG